MIKRLFYIVFLLVASCLVVYYILDLQPKTIRSQSVYDFAWPGVEAFVRLNKLDIETLLEKKQHHEKSPVPFEFLLDKKMPVPNELGVIYKEAEENDQKKMMVLVYDAAQLDLMWNYILKWKSAEKTKDGLLFVNIKGETFYFKNTGKVIVCSENPGMISQSLQYQESPADSAFSYVVKSLDPNTSNLILNLDWLSGIEKFKRDSSTKWVAFDLYESHRELVGTGLAFVHQPFSCKGKVRSEKNMVWQDVAALFHLENARKWRLEASADKNGAPYAEWKLQGRMQTAETVELSPDDDVQLKPENKPVEEKPIWTYKSNHQIAHGPWFVKNHHTKRENILMVTNKNNLVCIDHQGEKLWEAKITGNPVGEPAQVDVFRNNKLQIVLLTTEKLYVIDRLGRNVSPFPLSGQSTGELSIFDYNNTKDYRFVWPTSKGLLNYQSKGKKVVGWNEFNPGAAKINKTKHLKIGAKEYLVSSATDGEMYILNRRGSKRTSTPLNIGDSPGWGIIAGGSILNTKVVFVDNRKLWIKNMEGKVIKEQKLKFNPDTVMAYFHGGLLFIAADKNEVSFFDKNGKEFFNNQKLGKCKVLPTGNKAWPVLLQRKNDHLLISSKGETKIRHLGDVDAVAMYNGNNGSPRIVVVSGKEVRCY